MSADAAAIAEASAEEARRLKAEEKEIQLIKLRAEEEARPSSSKRRRRRWKARGHCRGQGDAVGGAEAYGSSDDDEEELHQ